jgi:hypothetical protein
MKMLRRLSALEAKSGVNQPPRIRVWLDEIEAKIDRIMERPDSADFWIGMWGQIFNRDSQLVEDEEN